MNGQTTISKNDSLLRKAVFKAHGGHCFYTQKRIGIDEMVIDHIFPKKHGGKDCIDNYVPTCNRVNLRKGNKWDGLSVERIIYINQIAFVPHVIKAYLQLQREVKNPEIHNHAVALGRLGGMKGGPARAAKLSKERLSEIATNAAHARWAKEKE